MRWSPGKRSDNLEDRRGDDSSQGGGFGGGGGGGRGGIRLGLGGTIVVLVLSVVFKQDLFSTLGVDGGSPVPLPAQQTQTGSRVSSPPLQTTTAEEKLVDFVSVVLDDAQTQWASTLADRNVRYRDAKLVLFRNSTQSGCGNAQSATGPFYCPADQKVYIDLGFYTELQERFGAPGDLAQAYVLAHELGHHIQNLLGTERELRRAQEEHPDQRNALSVRMELQADCYAGVWAFSAQQRNKLEPGDLQEALSAAASVGDDRLQRMGGGHVTPDSFTHGSSEQRMSWFKKGFARGRIDDCDTFGRQ